MKLEEQLLSVELAKILFYTKATVNVDCEYIWVISNEKWIVIPKKDWIKNIQPIPALSIPELLEIMPDRIEKDSNDYCLTIQRNSEYYIADYMNWGVPINTDLKEYNKPADALGECLLWLIDNGYYVVKNENL